MTPIMPIIIAVLLVVLFFLVLKFFAKLVVLIFSLSALLLIILVVLGFIVILDANEFKDKFTTQEKLFLLQENNTVLTGIKFGSLNGSTPQFVNYDGVAYYTAELKNKNYKAILDTNYKVFIFDIRAFDNLEYPLQLPEGQYNKSMVYSILTSPNATETFYIYYTQMHPTQMPKEQVIATMRSSDQIKAQFFLILFGEGTKENPLFIFAAYKKEDVVVYPETELFKFIKFIPNSLVDKMLVKMKV